MCGINGIVSLKGERVSHSDIEKMNDAIKHRGPDDQGVFINGPVGFGHLRLAVLDLSPKGHQPMTYSHKGRDVVITYNGEVYNFLELRGRLKDKGYQFLSETDTEVIAAAYIEYGSTCLQFFNGMFSFAIYDLQEQTVFGARDRFGKKPFKYYLDENRFIFSSELKAILTHPISRNIDERAIEQFLTLQYIPAPRTGFQNIWKLEHGHFFTLSLKTGEFRKQRYFSLDYSQKLDLPVDEWKKKIISELDRAVSARLISDVPVGAFLSGGIDSSAVVASMRKHTDQVRTFTISFQEKKFDESRYARDVARFFQTEHHEFVAKAEDMRECMEDLIVHYEEPYADSSQLPTALLARHTRDHVTVALSGDGGDENFAGYRKHRIFLLLSRYPWFADMLKVIPSQWLPGKVALIKQMRAMSIPQQYRHITNFFDDALKKKMFTTDFQHLLSGNNPLVSPVVDQKSWDPIDQATWLDFNSYVPDDLSVKTDMASMRYALEVRSPFLDYQFVSAMAAMPSRLKLDLWQGKKILRDALRDQLPASILRRRKQGFSVPVDAWFRHELHPYLLEHVQDPGSIIYHFFEPAAVEQMIREHVSRGGHGHRLWMLLALDLWHRAYLI